MNISEKFKIIRKALHLNQAEFAKPLKISDKQISAIENGRVATSESVMELLFSNYFVNRIWWDTGEGEMFALPDNGIARDQPSPTGITIDGDPLMSEAISAMMKWPRSKLLRFIADQVEAEEKETKE